MEGIRFIPGPENPEVPLGHEAHRGGVALVERVLGVGPLTRLEVPEGEFSERNQVIEEAERIVRSRYERYVTVAEQLSGKVVAPDFVNWNPPEAEVAELRSLVREQKIRTQMLEGLAEFVDNKGRMQRLRPEQRDALRATRQFMEFATRMPNPDGTPSRGKSGYIDMPTGTGKTGAFISIAQALKLKESPDDPIKVLVIAPTNNILAQTLGDKTKKPSQRKGFAKFWPRSKPTEYSGSTKQISELTTMTNASFNKLVQSGRMQPGHELFEEQFDFDVIIVDESHTDLGPSISDSVRKYYSDKLTIAFSATPDYHAEKRTADLMQHEIFVIPMRDAIEGGAVAPIVAEHRELVLEFDEAELPEDPLERRRYIDRQYFKARLERSMPDIKKATREGKGVLVRCPPGTKQETGEDEWFARLAKNEAGKDVGDDVWFARLAANRIREELVTLEDRSYTGKIKAIAIGGKTHKARDLQIILGGFNNQNAHVLCYVDIVNMGTDLPPAKELHDLSPTRSRVKMVQGIGRTLRLIFDKMKRPIQAKVVTYDDPRMPDQYSCLDALEMREGQATLGFKKPYREKYDQVTYEYTLYNEPPKPKVSSEGVIGVLAIEHSGVVSPPEGGDLLSFEDVSREFGIDPEIVSQYLQDVGYEGEPDLPEDEYYALVEIIMQDLPDIPSQPKPVQEPEAAPSKRQRRIPYAPDKGYTAIDDFMTQKRWVRSRRALVDELRAAGVPIRLLRDPRSDSVKYYIPDTF